MQKKIILFDTQQHRNALYPFTLTRPIGLLRNGIFSIADRWHRRTGLTVHTLTESYLHTPITTHADLWLAVDATCWPDDDSLSLLMNLQENETLCDTEGIIAFATKTLPAYQQMPVWPANRFEIPKQYRIDWSPQIVADNHLWMQYDFSLINFAPVTQLHSSNTIFGGFKFLVHETASIKACTINTEEGAVVIDEGALVMEGSHLRGPVYIGKNAVIKMGSNLYGGTNIGEQCTAGGEIKNTIIMGYSNKAHEGYLGDSLIGEWCNLGAGTFVSNVKNTASAVRVWHAGKQSELPAGLKMGCLMGDYSRTAILTAINSGTTIGVCCSLHQPTIAEKNIPSFWWGNHQGYRLEKAIADAERWMQLKKQTAPATLRPMLSHIFEQTVSS